MTDICRDVDYTAAVDVTDLESVLSGASEVSWTSFVNWDEVDQLIAEVNWSLAQTYRSHYHRHLE